MNVALAQVNSAVGDFAGNTAKIRAAYAQGVQAGADLVVAPELAIPGYPPRDLLLRPEFIGQNLAALEDLARAVGSAGLLAGFAGRNDRAPGRPATNAVALLRNGRVEAIREKTLLPTYDVFDEDRYFEPADTNAPVDFQGCPLGLTICEDVWNDEDFWRERRYRRDPAINLVQQGARILFNVSASPWHLGKETTRHAMLANLASKARVPVVYVNLVGGNDELVFDGRSLAFNRDGALIAQAAMFAEDLVLVDLDAAPPCASAEAPDEEKLHRALVLGLRDYLQKCGFQRALLGLSGGIDSALTACLAVDALGSAEVWGVALPSQFSSAGSLDDARQLARNLGIRYDVIPIQSAFATLRAELAPVFAGHPEDVTEENLQARLRGVILMALSNKFGGLLLTTGNKSELAVGYCTLYGDMCGGLAVLSDLPKTMVYRLARWINRDREIIPTASITKPPSAELRPNQTDQDSLPPYDVLDAILDAYIVEGLSPQAIANRGHDPATVRQVIRLVSRAEFKRRQAAPGLKVTSKAFGVGRRIPIAQRFREA
ncbi:MAG TPA: NAD+ synthase [Candidatus Paceibacterota bacterium]|nr:NAD+ synthase [Verrucomicrobiota bacterium]HRZ43685.1 NAD+ synthase [Candidatus Paceibacterota bacterium]